MRTSLIRSLLGVLLGFALQAAAWTVDAAALTLLRSPVSAPGDVLTVVLSVDDVSALGVSQVEALDVEVSFDATSLEFIGARAGNAFPAGSSAPAVLPYEPSPGSLKVLLATSAGAAPVENGSGLLVLEFRVAAGATAFDDLSAAGVVVEVPEYLASFTFDGPGLLDGDGDGINDAFESLIGLNPTDPTDAALDPDLDGFNTLDEVLAGSDPFDGDSLPRAPYVVGDLPGEWEVFSYSDDAAQANAPWAEHCAIRLDADGVSVAGGICKDFDSDGETLAAGGLELVLGATGEVNLGGPLGDDPGANFAAISDAHMDLGRTVVARIEGLVGTGPNAGIMGEQVLNVFLKRGSGYRQADLTGDWHLFQFGDNVLPGVDDNFWLRYFLRFDASGTLLSGSLRFEDDAPDESVTGGASVSDIGAVQASGALSPALAFEHMDAGKTVISGVLRESFAGDTLRDDSLRVWLKQGESYAQSDATGVWHASLISDAAGLQDPLVEKLTFVVDAAGGLTADGFNGAGEVYTFGGTMLFSNAEGALGLLGLGGDDLSDVLTHQHLRMDAGKTVIAGVLNEDDEGMRRPGLLVAVKSVASPPELVFPAPGSALEDTAARFAWTSNGTPSLSWYFALGSTPGADDVYASAQLPGSTRVAEVGGLPNDGRVLHATLYYEPSPGVFDTVAAQYLAFDADGVVNPPSFTDPAPGSKFSGADVVFQWHTGGTSVRSWYLTLGNAPGGNELYDSGSLGPLTVQHAVSGLPVDGRALYARLYYETSPGAFGIVDTQYEAAGTAPLTPIITAPVPGTVLGGATATFSWDAQGSAVELWFLTVGTAPAGDDLFSGLATGGNQLVSGLPRNSNPLYATLYYNSDGGWATTSAVYTAAAPLPLPALSGPAPGALTATSATFSWTGNDNPVTRWYLTLGTTAGGVDLFNAEVTDAGGSQLIAGLPSNGVPVYATMYYLTDTWHTLSVKYKAVTLSPATFAAPTAGSTLGLSTTFAWNENGHTASEWYLVVGTTSGGNDLFAGYVQNGEQLVSGLPNGGVPVYATLYYKVAGLWASASAPYVAAPAPALTAPLAGVLTATSATFTWDARNNPVTRWYLTVGTTAGGVNLFNAEVTDANGSQLIAGLPSNGVPVYATMYYFTDTWHSLSVKYTAVMLSPATFTAPTAGSTLGLSTTFAWNENGHTASEWYLVVGTTPGGNNLFANYVQDGVQLVSGLPNGGVPVYATLYYKVAGVWASASAQYSAAPAPALSGPAAGALDATSATFSWTDNGNAVTRWYLTVGTTTGGVDLFNAEVTDAGGSQLIAGLPSNGVPVYATMYYLTDTWHTLSVKYKAVTLSPATFAAPTAGSTLGLSTTFAWNENGHTASEWYLVVGTTPAGNDLFAGYVEGGSREVSGLPNGGVPVYATLYYKVAGVWASASAPYVAAPAPALTAPLAGPLGGTSATFTWDANDNPVTRWYLTVGTTAGGVELFNAEVTDANGAQLIAELPSNGVPMYATMYYFTDTWYSLPVKYTAVTLAPATFTAPTAGSTLGSSATLEWNENGHTAPEWYLVVGTTPGGNNLFAGYVQDGEQLVSGLPNGGVPVYATLYYKVAGVWSAPVIAQYSAAP